MKLYPLSAIKIAPDRQRQEFDAQAMEELKSSIEARGLLHAPVVRTKNGEPWLVAGERRLKAMEDIYALDGVFKYNGTFLPHGMIPTVDLGDLNPLEAEEAELDENLKRRDLTWQEQADAHARLHKLRQAQKEEVKDTALNKGDYASVLDYTPHTVADTARELTGRSDGSFQDNVRKEIIVARNLHKPEVAKAKTLDEAFKILKRSEQQEANRELALEVGKTFTAEKHRVFHQNCLGWMAGQQPEQFDVILTDPPYGMGADEFGDGAGKLLTIEHDYVDSYENWVSLMADWCEMSYALAKPQAHAYVFCDIDRFHELKSMMQLAGWYVHRTPLIDYKTDSGRVPLPDRGPRRQWEMILYAIKGDKPVTHIYPDVIPCQADEQMGHGAQKPVALYVNLLKRSIRPGDKVLDTFGGSGTLIPACHSLQCEATVIEQSAASYGMCLKRLHAVQASEGGLAALTAGLDVS